MVGTPTPSPTPIASLSLVARPEEPVALGEELPLFPPLPDVGEEVSPVVVGSVSLEIAALLVGVDPPA